MSAVCATCGHTKPAHSPWMDGCAHDDCTAYVAPTTGSTDADRARLAELRVKYWDHDPDLCRMAEDGIAAREAVERVRGEVTSWNNQYQDDRVQVQGLIAKVLRALDAAPEVTTKPV